MLDLAFWIIVFIVALAVLVKASDLFTDSAEKIGLHFGIPPFIVGVTIVAIGTSLPELVASFVAIFWGVPEIAVGNVVGSNIANIFLIIGVVAIISKKIKIFYELKHVDLPFLMGSTMLSAFVLFDGQIVFFESVLLLAVLVSYLLYTISSRKNRPDAEIKKELKKEKDLISGNKKLKWTTWFWLAAGAVLIYFGAQLIISSVLNISEILVIGAGLIAVSAVALGTSLPELVVSITAARKKQPEMAIGNVIGSNIFNSLAVLGIPGLFGTIFLGTIVFEFSSILLLIMVAATLLYYFMVEDKEITSWEGWLLLIFYVFFIAYLFGIV
jgi:cation:H+ antiporter